MALDLAQLASDLGAYYRDKKQEVLAKMYAAEDMRKYFQVVSGVQDEYVMTEMLFDELTQPYQKAWTPKGTGTFSPEILKNRPVKVDFTLEPKALEATWIGYLKTNGSSHEEYPFVQYIYERIIEKVARELNYTTINGVYAAPTPGTAGAAAAAFNGILKIVTDAITATKITPTATGALSTSNIRTKVEQMVDALPTEHRDQELVMLMSPSWARAYFRLNRTDFGANIDYKAGETTVDFTNVKIVTPQYMNGSSRMIITPAANLFLLEDGVNEQEKMIVQANRRELEVMMDFKRGVGFGIIENYVWTNDQA